MRKSGVHQLFVQGAEPCAVVGTLSYGDVVALLYRYCRACPKGAVGRSGASGPGDRTQFLTVRDAMRTPVMTCGQGDSLAEVIEKLTSHRLGAVLIVDGKGLPVGVISKTDIILAYRHGASLDVEAQSILKSPAAFCDENCLLTEAIRQMFLKDVQRLFAYAGTVAHQRRAFSIGRRADAFRFVPSVHGQPDDSPAVSSRKRCTEMVVFFRLMFMQWFLDKRGNRNG